MSQKLLLRSPNGDIPSILRSLRGISDREADVMNDWLLEISTQLVDIEHKMERRRGLLRQAEDSIRELKESLELPTLLKKSAEARLSLLSTQRTGICNLLDKEGITEEMRKNGDWKVLSSPSDSGVYSSPRQLILGQAEEMLKRLNSSIIYETTSVTQLDDLMHQTILSLSQNVTTADSLKRSISEHEKFAASLRREIGDFTGSNEGSYPHIWRQIFSHAVALAPIQSKDEESEESNNTPKDSVALYALRLSHVCRLWRRICLGHSALWDKISLRAYMNPIQASKWIAFQAEKVRTKSISFDISRFNMKYNLTCFDARISSSVVSAAYGNIVQGDDEGYSMYQLDHVNSLTLSAPKDTIIAMVNLSSWNLQSLALYNVTPLLQPVMASKLTYLSITFTFSPDERFLESIFSLTKNVTTLRLHYRNRSPIVFDVNITSSLLPRLHSLSTTYGLLSSRLFITEEHCINQLSISGGIDDVQVDSEDPSTTNEDAAASLWSDIFVHCPGLKDSVSELELHPSDGPFIEHTALLELVKSFQSLHTLRYHDRDISEFLHTLMKSSQDLEQLHLIDADLEDGTLLQFLEKENIHVRKLTLENCIVTTEECRRLKKKVENLNIVC
ncbi:hypothetical protein FRC19_009063 [Serendipita sp. 401]|nr:hypothetical protein FRC19_009063 [Serendipita sp. 401]KAG9053264.1 hypothetical protein FS842_008423 [Serendipita sp. 407]